MFDHLEDCAIVRLAADARGRRGALRQPLPHPPGYPAAAWRQLQEQVIPYAADNTHPGFMGWVQGAGTPIGMLAS